MSFRAKQQVFATLCFALNDNYKCLFLAILIQPCEEFTIPMNGVLWLQDPVVFFREEEELGFHTHHASRIECSHTLVNRYTVVHFAVCHENRSVPVLDKLVSRVAIVTVGLRSAVPWSATVVEVREPHFFGHHVHVFLVEDTGMSDECREAVLMDTC